MPLDSNFFANDPYDLMTADPFGKLFGGDRVYPKAPTLTEDQQQSLLSRAGSGTIGLLQYLGQSLNKPFNALAHVATGHPEGLLHAIPFSDAMGITNPNDVVSGRDVLENWGIAPPNIPGTFNDFNDTLWDAAGLATEIAFDPLIWLTGPTGTMLKSTPEAMKVARGIGTTGDLLKSVEEGSHALVGFKVPFTKQALFGFGTGDKAAGVLESMAKSAPVRRWRQFFDWRVGNTYSWPLQMQSEQTLTRLPGDLAKARMLTLDQKELMAKLFDQYTDAARQAAAATGTTVDEMAVRQAALGSMRRELEGVNVLPTAEHIADPIMKALPDMKPEEAMAVANVIRSIAANTAQREGITVGGAFGRMMAPVMEGDLRPLYSEHVQWVGDEADKLFPSLSGVTQNSIFMHRSAPGTYVARIPGAPIADAVFHTPIEATNHILQQMQELKLIPGIQALEGVSLVAPEGLAASADMAGKVAIQLGQDGKAILRAFKGTNPSTIIKAVGEILARHLPYQDLAAMEHWVGKVADQWGPEQWSSVGNALARYVMEGATPNPGVQEAFKTLGGSLKGSYQAMRDAGVEEAALDPRMKRLFDRVFDIPVKKGNGMEYQSMLDESVKEAGRLGGITSFGERLGVTIPYQDRVRLLKALESAGLDSTIKEIGDQTTRTFNYLEDLGAPVSKLMGEEAFNEYFPRRPSAYARQAMRTMVLEDVSPSRLGWSGKLREGDPFFFQRDPALRNIPGGTDTINQMVRDPRVSGVKNLVGPSAENTLRGEDAVNHLVSTYGLSREQAQKTVPYLAGIPRKFAAKQLDLFDRHVLADLLEYQEAAMHASAGLRSFRDLLLEARIPQDMGGVPLEEAWRRLGLTDHGLETLQKEYFAKHSKDLQIKEVRVPEIILKDAKRVIDPMISPNAPSPFLDLWGKAQGLLKTWLTSPWPAFASRNFTAGQWSNYVMGQFSLDSLAAARKLLKTQGASDPEMWRLISAHEVAGSHIGQHADFLTAVDYRKELAAGEGAVESKSILSNLNPFDVRGFTGLPRSGNILVRTGEGANDWVEWMNRVSPFIELVKKQGMDPAEAAARVGLAQVNYSNLSSFEKTYMRRLIPFYTYAASQVPWQIKKVLANPGGATAQTMRAVRYLRGEGEGEEYIPKYLQEEMAIPTGGGSFLTSFGLPLEDLNRINVGTGFPITGQAIQRTGEQMASYITPYITGPFEQIFNRDLYTGRNLSDMDTFTGNQMLDQLIYSSPASRGMGTVRKLLDPRKDALAKTVNFLTGIKTSNVDVPKWMLLDLRDMLQREILRSGKGRKYTDVFVPKDLRPTIDMDLRENLDAYQKVKNTIEHNRSATPPP